MQSQPIIKVVQLRILANLSLVYDKQHHIAEKVMEVMNQMVEAGFKDRKAVNEIITKMLVPKIISFKTVGTTEDSFPTAVIKGLTKMALNGAAKCFIKLIPKMKEWMQQEYQEIVKDS